MKFIINLAVNTVLRLYILSIKKS